MLKKTHRLAKTKDVKAVFGRGRGFFNAYLTVKFKDNPSVCRFTVVISTKVSKKAVIRNRLKRVIREFIRLKLTGFRMGDYIIILKPAAVSISESELLLALQRLLKSSKLLV